MGPHDEGVEEGVFASVGGGVDDAAGASFAVVGVFDEVVDGGGVCSKLGVAEEDFHVGGLVGAVELFGLDLGDDYAGGDAGLGVIDFAGGGDVGVGGAAFDVGDVVAPVAQEGGRDGFEYGVDLAHQLR